MSRKAELTTLEKRAHVVAGILRNAAGQVLISDRVNAASMRQYWEFPGGKVEAGESLERALSRELREELGVCDIRAAHFTRVEHDYPDLHVAIDFFVVSSWQGTPVGLEGQRLRWTNLADLDAGRLLPADAPVVDALRRKY